MYAAMTTHQDAIRIREAHNKAAVKHIKVFPFQPDIGQAKVRHVESDRDQFVQRLHDQHRQQEEHIKKLREEYYAKETAGNHKVIKRREVDAFVDR
jgi:hypothetical protein